MKNFKNILIIFIAFLSFGSATAQDFYTEKEILDAKTHAYALYNVSKKDEALQILKKMPKKYLTEDMCIVMANIYEDKGDTRQAYNNLNLALQINEKSYKAYYNLGLIAYKEGSIPLAVENFKKSIKYNPSFSYSKYNLALCYMKMNEYVKAKNELIKAIELEQDKNFYYNLAYVYKKLNKEKEAKRVLESYNNMN